MIEAAARIEETGVKLTDKTEPCETCKIQNTQKKHPKTAQHIAVQPCQRVYTDLLGPTSPPAKGGYIYVSKFTDEYSRMNIVYLTRSKDEAINTLDRFIHDIVIPNGTSARPTNGISERAGRTLIMNIVRCLMHGGKLPEFLWGELCCMTVHFTNRLPHVHLNHETPYYRMFGKQASLRHLRVIGSTAFVHLETYKSKLANRA
ncbi:unnamed protein product [Ectocarpus sp. CCAP 1310/34]|nr:unnamed protein product [Ectocarpus sp. CCAP 1310/34]